MSYAITAERANQIEKSKELLSEYITYETQDDRSYIFLGYLEVMYNGSDEKALEYLKKFRKLRKEKSYERAEETLQLLKLLKEKNITNCSDLIDLKYGICKNKKPKNPYKSF